VFNLLRGLVDLIYPPGCLLCGQAPPSGHDRFCAACAGSLFDDPHPSCPRCAARVGPFAVRDGTCAVCRHTPVAFTAAVRMGPYLPRSDESQPVHPLSDAIRRLKSAHYEGLAEVLGECLAERQHARLSSLGADVIVPVPLHWRRRLARGYNQSAAIAHGLGTRLGLPCRYLWLWRVKNTPSQRGLSATARWDNVRNAFRARAAGRLAGRHVLLVDDVMTTTATASEAARALLEGGAARVSMAVLARTES
jgi:ComF family protein